LLESCLTYSIKAKQERKVSYHIAALRNVEGRLRFDGVAAFGRLAACIDFINDRPDSDFLLQDDFGICEYIDAAPASAAANQTVSAPPSVQKSHVGRPG
jgi:hypothetical protein